MRSFLLPLALLCVSGMAEASTIYPHVFELARGQIWKWTLPVQAGHRYIVTANVLGGIDLHIDGNIASPSVTEGAPAVEWTVTDASDGTWFIAPTDGQVVVSVTGHTGFARGVVSVEQR